MVARSIFALNLDQLTKEEMSKIGELRKIIKPELTAKYMAEDYFLAKWLYQTDFCVGEALQLLRQHLKWRKDESIHTILEESWDDMRILFPYSCHTIDKSGKPVLYFDLTEWNISKFLSDDYDYDSRSNRLGRYIVMLHEEAEAQVRQFRASGVSITQFNLLINLDGYCTEKHASFRCFYFYRHVANILSPHFPRCVERVAFVNVPPLFKLAYMFLSKENQNCINIFGRDQSIWEPVLLEYIQRDLIPGNLLKK